MSSIIIFANGNYQDPKITRPLIRPGDFIIAADGGARQALLLGIDPQIIIGDMDSLSRFECDYFEQKNIEMLRYPAEKDQTDLELAVSYAVQSGASRITILGALGDRLDQEIGNIALLSDPALDHLDVRLDDGITEAFFIHQSAEIAGSIDDTVSFIPWGSNVTGVTTEGLAYPLRGETLIPYRTRSVSNRMVSISAKVNLESGLLLCIHIRKQ